MPSNCLRKGGFTSSFDLLVFWWSVVKALLYFNPYSYIHYDEAFPRTYKETVTQTKEIVLTNDMDICTIFPEQIKFKSLELPGL